MKPLEPVAIHHQSFPLTMIICDSSAQLAVDNLFIRLDFLQTT